jgi:hypothetical protein
MSILQLLHEHLSNALLFLTSWINYLFNKTDNVRFNNITFTIHIQQLENVFNIVLLTAKCFL